MRGTRNRDAGRTGGIVEPARLDGVDVGAQHGLVGGDKAQQLRVGIRAEPAVVGVGVLGCVGDERRALPRLALRQTHGGRERPRREIDDVR
jgi:hypothetical protein